MKRMIAKLWKDNKFFLVFMALMFVFRSAVADWNDVPTGSMKPTIMEGDRILVNKMAYDVRIPFTSVSVWERSNPMRGDIIVFNSEASGKRLVKRVVGVPGDLVELRDNILYVNEQRLDYKTLSSVGSKVDKLENLLGVEHFVRTNSNGSRLSSFQPVEVPVDYYLALGDNRDNSADSRVYGLVPRQEIIGNAKKVVLSLDYENYFIPRTERFFHTL